MIIKERIKINPPKKFDKTRLFAHDGIEKDVKNYLNKAKEVLNN